MWLVAKRGSGQADGQTDVRAGGGGGLGSVVVGECEGGRGVVIDERGGAGGRAGGVGGLRSVVVSEYEGDIV